MSIGAKIRRGEGPFWGALKGTARRVLHFHIPVAGPLRPFFGLLYGLHVGLREGLKWLLRFLWYEPLFRSRCAAVGAGLRMERLPYLYGSGRIVLGDRVRLSGRSAIGFGNRFHDAPELVIGDDTFVGHDCRFDVAASIRVGRHCLLAGGTRVADHDGHPLDAADRRAGKPEPPASVRPVVIGDDVWVGARATILKGVTVGDRAVIAAEAVVVKDVPPDVVVAGNPARVVKQLAGAADGDRDSFRPEGLSLGLGAG
jgi:acetyltransferase-like isoleucine patch superfamily enzyme